MLLNATAEVVGRDSSQSFQIKWNISHDNILIYLFRTSQKIIYQAIYLHWESVYITKCSYSVLWLEKTTCKECFIIIIIIISIVLSFCLADKTLHILFLTASALLWLL